MTRTEKANEILADIVVMMETKEAHGRTFAVSKLLSFAETEFIRGFKEGLKIGERNALENYHKNG